MIWAVRVTSVDGVVSAKAPSAFWIALTLAFLLITIYMGVVWYKVKRGTRVVRKNPLEFLTTERYREIWRRQKLRPSYYALRTWLAFAGTLFCLAKALNPTLR